MSKDSKNSDNSNSFSIWRQSGSSFTPANTSSQVETLLPGIYSYETTMFGWYLNRNQGCFIFPYKIYGEHNHILNRVKKAWSAIDSNLGILLNGVKGTGKTVTAQLIGNWAVQEGMPVILVTNPIPLATVLETVRQDCVIIFDEFEKTHKEKENQQALLSAIDGMSRNQYKRLFLFTSNEKKIEDNFIDRPSRIRYSWEFTRLEDEVIEKIMDDLLAPHLSNFRADIISYLSRRKVCSIDVVKTIINEVNIFEESPEVFASVMNLSELDVRSFKIQIVDERNQVTGVVDNFFSLDADECRILRGYLSKSGVLDFEAHRGECEQIKEFTYMPYGSHHGKKTIELVSPTNDPTVWEARIKISREETWFAAYPWIRDATYEEVWLDKKPDNWEIPDWAQFYIDSKGQDRTALDSEKRNEWAKYRTVYGGVPHNFRIKITPNITTAWDFKNPAF